MAYADRVQDTTTSSGTGAVTLSGTPATTYRALASVGSTGATFDYCMTNATDYEIGIGTITGTNTFSRSVQFSSNSNTAVNFAAGATFFVTVNATTAGRFAKRILALGNGATPAINTDIYDRVTITGLTTNITSMTSGLSGTAANGDSLIIDITGNSTYTIAWGASFEDSTISAPTQLVADAKLSVYWEWNAATTKWRCVGKA